MDRNIEIRANAIYPILQEGHSENKIKNAQFHAYIKGATEQRAIDDVELAEIKRQRDEYYDELLKLRQQKAIDDAELHERFEKVLNGQKWDLIDKACDWLENWAKATEWYTIEESIESLRKAMEKIDEEVL